jgi:hypothetical protein
MVKALELADWLEDQYDPTHKLEEAATELRNLHDQLVKANALARLRAERIKELLEYTAELIANPRLVIE